MNTIPLKAGARNARQQFTVTLGENQFDFSLSYLSYLDTPMWVCDIKRDGFPIILGSSIVVNGVIDLGRYGKLITVGREVTLDNLGIDNSLIWVVE